jgi:SET domain-containing protein
MEISIKKSKIQGKGVFAERDFKKGEVVVKHKFRVITKKEYESLPECDKGCVGVDGKKYLQFLAPSKYVNHSCNPNTFVKCGADVALRDIKKGEEITNYYEDDDPEFQMVCNCGSKNCKKVIKNKIKWN